MKYELEKQGIETLYKYKGQTSEIQGISFKSGDYKYKGSEVDRNFSIKNIERVLHEQQAKQIQQDPAPFNADAVWQSFKQDVHQSNENSVLNELIKPEQIQQQISGQLIKRRKKKKGLHL
ncbi:MAG: hypothetical protein WKF91_16480 [Segetibacter sp.]